MNFIDFFFNNNKIVSPIYVVNSSNTAYETILLDFTGYVKKRFFCVMNIIVILFIDYFDQFIYWMWLF